MEIIFRKKCKAVENGEVKRKGKCAETFKFNGKTKHSCGGYIDLMTDEAIEECRNCPLYIWNVSEEFQQYMKNKRSNK